MHNVVDGCGPNVRLALPVLVLSLHLECLVGNRVPVIIMMTDYAIKLSI